MGLLLKQVADLGGGGDSSTTGINWTEESNQISKDQSTMYDGFGGLYLPYSDKYFFRLRICRVSGPDTCTISRSTQYIDSTALTLNGQTPLLEQNPKFSFPVGAQIPAKSSMCYTFIDSKGNEWSTSAMRTCQDGGRLPSTPATCYLNQNIDLNIEMGSLERGKIATVAASGTSGNIKKTFPVLCTRDGGVTVKTTFQFTPLIVNGNEVVSTSTPNLGVAIFYNGKLVGPASTPVTETFETGYTDRELEFQAVRIPDAVPGDIPTGKFSASAIMVMTEQ